MPVLDSVRQVHTVTQLRGYVGELMCDDKISGQLEFTQLREVVELAVIAV
jgi:hypothetical protein